MAYSRPSKSLRDMTAAERAHHYAMVDADMARVSADLAGSWKRNNQPTECVISDYLRWGRSRMQCMLLVRHDYPSVRSIKVSRDGSQSPVAYLPTSRVEIRPQSSGPFVLVMVPNWLREKLPPTFSGVTPELVGEWASEQRKQWADLAAVARRINHEIQMTPRRLKRRRSQSNITSCISPSNAA